MLMVKIPLPIKQTLKNYNSYPAAMILSLMGLTTCQEDQASQK
ncbi:hypothetical protein AO373_1919 [Moraxella catarrhalis]|nr:hypothetical protein AO373_1919 [Moraxella catarrhalis]